MSKIIDFQVKEVATANKPYYYVYEMKGGLGMIHLQSKEKIISNTEE